MKKIIIGITAITYLNLIGCINPSKQDDKQLPYNVLMIMVDDQKPILEATIKTPNLDRLKERSIVFNRAYCAAPACGPSRASLLTGISPATSGVYYNNQNFRQADGWLSNVIDLPRHFKNNGYLTTNFGKIFHHGQQTEDNKESFSKGHFFPFSSKEDNVLYKEAIDTTRLKQGATWSYGPLPDEYDLEDTTKMQQDTKNANRTINFLQEDHGKPFFISLGLWKPHLPWYVPKRYYEMYPTEDIAIPEGYHDDDLDDLPEIAKWVATHRGFHQDIIKRGLWEKTLQAKYASITYADEQLGRVIAALENSKYANNTIIVVMGDNGFHTGEKNSWSKFKLWDMATRVPLLISLPKNFQNAGLSYDLPVSLLDIYPTLIELCQLPNPESHKLDGESLVPILKVVEAKRSTPVISTYGKENHAIISESNYYISYRNGSKELYNMDNDLYQWYNLVNDPAYENIIDSITQFLPKKNAEGITKKGSHSWIDFQ
jgi:arylsulfatase A-like enzyme